MERLLITKLVRRPDNKADLYGRGHQYKDLTLFDISDLADGGVDYEALEAGVEVPCRLWAFYELSDKLNKAGNPYKDVVKLEPIGAPASTTSTDTTALLEELRAIRVLLETIAQALPTQAAPLPTFPQDATRDLDVVFAEEYGDGQSIDLDNETEYKAFYAYIDHTGHVPANRETLREWFKEHGQQANGSQLPPQ